MWDLATPRFFITILMACSAHPAGGVTLEAVLQTTLEKNPAIQEAKSGLEQAAGQRLVLRSIVWPNVELGVPAGIQGELVVGEDVGALPRVGPGLDTNDRDAFDPEQLCPLEPAWPAMTTPFASVNIGSSRRS